MPVVSVGRDKLFHALGKTYSKRKSFHKRPNQSRYTKPRASLFFIYTLTLKPCRLLRYCKCAGQEDFEGLCFDYGVELDDVVSTRSGE